jgi:hypothetical protein
MGEDIELSQRAASAARTRSRHAASPIANAYRSLTTSPPNFIIWLSARTPAAISAIF